MEGDNGINERDFWGCFWFLFGFGFFLMLEVLEKAEEEQGAVDQCLGFLAWRVQSALALAIQIALSWG